MYTIIAITVSTSRVHVIDRDQVDQNRRTIAADRHRIVGSRSWANTNRRCRCAGGQLIAEHSLKPVVLAAILVQASCKCPNRKQRRSYQPESVPVRGNAMGRSAATMGKSTAQGCPGHSSCGFPKAPCRILGRLLQRDSTCWRQHARQRHNKGLEGSSC